MRLLAIALCCALSSSAQAQPLSGQGRQIVDGSLGFSWSNASQPGTLYREPHYALWLDPSWLYFVREGLGLGAYVGYRFARESTGIQGRWAEQTRPSPQLDGNRPHTWTYQPFSHQLSVGLTAAFRLFESGRISLFARPYAGVAVAWREVRKRRELGPYGLDPNFPATLDWQWRHELRPTAGIRVPVVYQLTGNLGLGLGPDFHWQRTQSGFNSFSLGVSSWIARSF